MNKLIRYASVVFALLTTTLVSTSAIASNRILNLKKRDIDIIRRREIKAKRLNEEKYNAYGPKIVTIPSYNGYTLTSEIIDCHHNGPWMIFCHGVTESRISSIKFIDFFVGLGFNCVIFDHRRHGDSGGTDSTYGFYEKYDLQSVITYLKEQYGQNITFGVHGESMGAATALLYAGELASEARFYIADCSFASFESELTHVIKQHFKISTGLFLYFINIFFKMRSEFSLYRVSPINIVHHIEQPVLFIHSKPDTFIPYEHSVELYNKKRGPKQKWFPEYGGHAASYNVNPLSYEQTVYDFLKTFDLLPKQMNTNTKNKLKKLKK